MYEISVPMPYEKEFIDKIITINNQIEKSKITNVYFALPVTDYDKTGFEQTRVGNVNCTKFEDWLEIILYAKEKGLDFIYLLNSPKPLIFESPYLLKQLEKLDNLINKFRENDIKKLRISNVQLMGYIAKHYPDMELYGSTSFEYTSIKQYQNLMLTFPQIKQIVPSHEVNKNFELLKNLKKQFPDLSIEIMVNEGCLGGCPFRFWHPMSFSSIMSPYIDKLDKDLTYHWFNKNCGVINKKKGIISIFTANNIYPWELEEYAKIGINQFKLVGRNSFEFIKGKTLDFYLQYLKGIDDYKNIENELFRNLIHYHSSNLNFNYKVKDLKPYLPNIKHFVKNGHLCSSICGSECTYCYKCAAEFEKHIGKTIKM